jgi:hypothetical protein
MRGASFLTSGRLRQARSGGAKSLRFCLSRGSARLDLRATAKLDLGAQSERTIIPALFSPRCCPYPCCSIFPAALFDLVDSVRFIALSLRFELSLALPF